VTDQEVMQEVRDLVAFYDARGANWLMAAEYTLGLRSGELDRKHWLNDYILIPKRGRWTEVEKEAARKRHSDTKRGINR
jgi:hypothetical protein